MQDLSDLIEVSCPANKDCSGAHFKQRYANKETNKRVIVSTKKIKLYFSALLDVVLMY